MFALFNLSNEQREQILAEAMVKAQEYARKNGIAKDATVTHPDLELTYALASVDERGIAVLVIPVQYSETGEQLVAEKPYDEIFDVNICKEIAMQMAQQEFEEGMEATFDIGATVELKV